MEEKQKKQSSGKIVKNLLHGVGRRKSAVARVWLTKGDGKIEVNGKDYSEYFDTDLTRRMVKSPIKISGMEKSFSIKVNVLGGGRVGQAGAVRLGISRALLVCDESLRQQLRKHSFLTVDSRKKERKKYGQKGARRKFQFVKR
jgi:small subunit ribosomal protein S9